MMRNLLARRDIYFLRSSNKRLASAKRSEDGSVDKKYCQRSSPAKRVRHLSSRAAGPIGIRSADKRFEIGMYCD